MSNFTVHCKKQWKGCVDIRDYNVQRCIRENRNIEVTCDMLPGVMILTPEQLKEPDMISRKSFTSGLGTEPYKLHSYKWNPN